MLAIALTVVLDVVYAQPSTDISRAPTLTVERYPEDWSALADPAARTGRWTERFKYIPLDDNGSVYLTTGLEARSRYESNARPNWGLEPDDDYVWHRLMPYVDLHAGKVRLFAQPIYTAIAGADRAKAPVDTTGADMLQAFAEVDVDVAENISLQLSAGRRLVALGAGRLIDTRYGPNVPLAFDGAEARLTGQTRQLRLFYMRPIENGLGDFDDRTSRRRAVWGVYATQWRKEDRASGLDLYYLGFRDRNAIFDQGAGREVIHNFGARIFADTGSWYWNIEGVLQRGTFATKNVAAWGIGGEIGYRFRHMPLRPKIALTADLASGDNDPDDRKLGTFNAMFPRGKYFASQAPVGPRNLIHIQPSITVQPHRDLAVSLTGVGYWRESSGDGIYSIPGFLVRSGRNSDARFIGKQLELAVSWQTTQELNLSASMSAFKAGAFIRDTGPARTTNVAAVAATFRY